MQGIGGPDEDRSGGFERGGWTTTLFDEKTMKFMDDVFGRADAFLFGRRTYVMFADSWGAMADPGGSGVWAALHAQPKYVVSATLIGADRALELVESRTIPIGVAIQVYRPAGRPEYGTATADLKHVKK